MTDIGMAPLVVALVVAPLWVKELRRTRLRNPFLISLVCFGVGAWSWLWKGRA